MFEFKSKKINKFRFRPLKFLFIFILVFANIFLVYYIYVNTILINAPLHEVYADNVVLTKNEEIQKVGDTIINSMPIKLNVEVEGENFYVPLSELNIKVNTDEIINYGKGSDYIKVFSEAIALLTGNKLQIDYTLNPSAILDHYTVKLNSSNPCKVSQSSYVNYIKDSFNFDIDNNKLSNLIKTALNNKINLKFTLKDILINTTDYNLFTICKRYGEDINKLQQSLNKLNGSLLAKDIFFMKIRDSQAYWELSNDSSIRTLLNKYKSTFDTLPSDGKYVLQNNKILLLSNYQKGQTLDTEASISNISNWLNSVTDTLPLSIISSDPPILKINKEILDFTQLMGVGKTRIDLIRNGAPNSVVPYTMYGLEEVQNMVVQPHQEFSYLKTIQPQPNGLTKAGRPIAPGICNSTTTLFRGILESGYQVTDRSNHEHYVPSYEWGYPYNILDAAYYTNPDVDFKFINDSDYPLLIQVTFSRDTDWQYNDVYIYSSSKAQKRTVQLTNWKIWDQYARTKFKGSFDRIVSIGDKIIRKETFSSQYF